MFELSAQKRCTASLLPTVHRHVYPSDGSTLSLLKRIECWNIVEVVEEHGERKKGEKEGRALSLLHFSLLVTKLE